MPGPPPNPSAVRRNARVGLVRLPAEGRKGRIPKWPLPDPPRLTALIAVVTARIVTLEEHELLGTLTRTQASHLTRNRQRLALLEEERDTLRAAETRIWRELWRTPQACEWERLRWTHDIALFARHQAAAEVGALEQSREARVRAESLGLTPKGMRALMWTITHDEVGERRRQGAPDRRRRLLAAVDPIAAQRPDLDDRGDG